MSVPERNESQAHRSAEDIAETPTAAPSARPEPSNTQVIADICRAINQVEGRLMPHLQGLRDVISKPRNLEEQENIVGHLEPWHC